MIDHIEATLIFSSHIQLKQIFSRANLKSFGRAEYFGKVEYSGKAEYFGKAKYFGKKEYFGKAEYSGKEEYFGKVEYFDKAEYFGWRSECQLLEKQITRPSGDSVKNTV